MALIPVEEALRRVLDGVKPLAAESVAVGDAHGRVLTKALAAHRAQPPADVSSMDGYAARSADLHPSGARLKVVGESAAGGGYDGTLRAGEAVRIFTGGIVPAGADTVVAQEDAVADGDGVRLPVSPAGKFIRRRGLDFGEGETLLPAGLRLSARDVGLAAAMDHAVVEVARRPRVAIIATGDELVAPGRGAGADRIVASNPIALAILARLEGAEVEDLGIVPDRLEDILSVLRRARGGKADVLVTLGGVSVGDHDLIAPALAADGIEIGFHRVALRPGRPLLLGLAGEARLLGMPGNPVSSFVCGLLFLVPLLRRLQGRSDAVPKPEPAVLGAALPANDHRQDYLRARVERSPDGRLVATALDRQDSSLQAALAASQGLLIRAPNAPAAPAGSPCEVLRFFD